MSEANQRSTPEGAKVNGSHEHAEQRYFALLRRVVEGLPENDRGRRVNFYIIAYFFVLIQKGWHQPMPSFLS